MSVQRLLLVCLRGSVEFRPSLWDIRGQTRLRLGHLYAWSRWLDRSRHKANFGENQLSLYSDTLSSVHILLICILLCWCYLWICDPWLPFLTNWTLVAFPSSVLAALYLFALRLFFTKATSAKQPGLNFYKVRTTTNKKEGNAVFANCIQTTFGDGLKCDI